MLAGFETVFRIVIKNNLPPAFRAFIAKNHLIK
jgi:hypothetical protein